MALLGRVLLTAFALLLYACPYAYGINPSLDITQYSHTSWTARDGLPGNVWAITQTPDGYLWLGTEAGLFRFDGVRFVGWSPPSGQRLPSTYIRSLAAGRDGTLWIGTFEGLVSWKDGKLTTYPELAGRNVLTLLQDRDGTVWAGTFRIPAARLCAIQGGAVHCYGDDGSLGGWVYSLYEDGEGRLWFGAETGLWRWKPGPPTRYVTPRPIEASQALVQGDAGADLIGIGDGLWRFAHEKITDYRPTGLRGGFNPLRLFRDRDGGLWIGTLNQGVLHVYRGKTTIFGQSDGLSSERVMSFFEDREGNVWVGTGEGVDLFRESPVFSVGVKQGLSSPGVWSVLVAGDNSVWLTTADGLNRWQNGHVTVYRSRRGLGAESARFRAAQRSSAPVEQAVTEVIDPGLPSDEVGSLFEDDRGRIWISTREAVARLDNGKFTSVKEVPSGWVNAITGDSKDGVWISYQDHGLVHWLHGKVVETVPWSRLGGAVVAASIRADPSGGLWVGFFQGGLIYYRDGQVRASYKKSDGLGAGRVVGLQLEKDGTLWAATEGGLSRLKDGRIATLNHANGLPCDTVHWAMQGDGWLWLNTPCGLLRIAKTEVDKWEADSQRKVPFIAFDSSDGARIHAVPTGYSPRASKSADGWLWYASFETASVVDMAHVGLNKIPPPVLIEQVIADGKVYVPVRGLRLPPRVRDVMINYTALTFVAPEKVRFRFKLDGQDRDWREVINDRDVQYSNLSPGNYRFRVMACNNSGVWNQQGASLDFSVAPAYWQTNWFRALFLLVILVLVWWLHELRVRQLAHEFKLRLEERVGERTRIARDLHDTLLQSFQGVLLRFETVYRLLPLHPEQARETLGNAIEHAADAIAEGRDAVQGLRSSATEHNDLVAAIGNLAKEFGANAAGPKTPAFRLDIAGSPRKLHPILRDEVYRIGSEALSNAFRHAEAQHIEVKIEYDDSCFRVVIRDDGKGIASSVLAGEEPEGHYGLPGMRERAALIGGKLGIQSKEHGGTEIELTIPGRIAYAHPPSGWSKEAGVES